MLTHADLTPGNRELYAHLDGFWRDKNVCWPGYQVPEEVDSRPPVCKKDAWHDMR